MLLLRKYIAAGLVVFCFGVLAILMRNGPACIPSKRHTSSSVRYLQTGLDKSSEILNTLKEQRNNLAKQLNDLRQKLGRIDCEVNNDTT